MINWDIGTTAINWDNDILEYCAVKQNMLRQLVDDVKKRGDMMNDEEIKACKIIRMLCDKDFKHKAMPVMREFQAVNFQLRGRS